MLEVTSSTKRWVELNLLVIGHTKRDRSDRLLAAAAIVVSIATCGKSTVAVVTSLLHSHLLPPATEARSRLPALVGCSPHFRLNCTFEISCVPALGRYPGGTLAWLCTVVDTSKREPNREVRLSSFYFDEMAELGNATSICR